jgi:hypothetical protein
VNMFMAELNEPALTYSSNGFPAALWCRSWSSDIGILLWNLTRVIILSLLPSRMTPYSLVDIYIKLIITGTTALCEPWPSSELFAIFPIVGPSGYSFFGFLNNLIVTV